LQDIIATGRASLAEMRRLLGVVRAAPQLAPQPGIAALPALVDQVRAAGTPVRLDIDGEPVPMPAGVDLSAYRIVQEALTNTLKHGGPGARALVRLGFTAEHLEVEVTDDGVSELIPSTVDGGNGLRGIAERVGMLHGELTVGPGPEGGFRVRARLPIEAAAVP
jgi:signal transduction histidine kinase